MCLLFLCVCIYSKFIVTATCKLQELLWGKGRGMRNKQMYYIIGHQNSCYWLLFFPPFQIEMLPDGLFQCKKLQCLLLGRNSLMSLSPHVGELSNLTHLELVGNYLETLPPELEACQSLKRSCLVVEENLLNTLPLPVTERLQSCLDKC